jgi:hypothetical protein
MINLLTEDMLAAIDNIEMSEEDRVIIKAVLYQERQNKERTWDSDAEKYITKLIDGNAPKEKAE